MDSTVGIIFALAIIVISVLVMRLVGAWMLRINEVITNQDRIEKILLAIHDELKSRKG